MNKFESLWKLIEEKAKQWGVKPQQMLAYTILKEVEKILEHD
jgi:hypothetical protein